MPAAKRSAARVPLSRFLIADTGKSQGNNRVPVGQTPCEFVALHICRAAIAIRDKLMNFAWNNFRADQPTASAVQAICDWVHNNMIPLHVPSRDLSESEVIERRYGVLPRFRPCGHRTLPRVQFARALCDGTSAGHRLH